MLKAIEKRKGLDLTYEELKHSFNIGHVCSVPGLDLTYEELKQRVWSQSERIVKRFRSYL